MKLREWLPTAVLLLAQLLAIAYSFGSVNGRLASMDKRLDQIERVLLERGARAAAQ